MAARKPKRKPLFYFEALSTWDKIVIGVYGFATIIVLSYVRWGEDNHKSDMVIFYALIPQIFNYLFNYQSLRNLKSYLIWVSFAVIQIGLYFCLKDDLFHKGARGILLNTIVLLILYQLLRIASLKIQNQDLVMPSRDGKDLFSNRQITFLDFVLFIIYIGSFGGLSVFAVSHPY